jgi:hypothetical protein
MRRLVFLVALLSLASAASAAVLRPGRVRFEVTWKSSWTSSEHRLRFMSDEAELISRFDLAVTGSASSGGSTVALTPVAFDVRRTKRAKVSGFFSDSDSTAKGGVQWEAGQPDPPPSFNGEGRWPLEGWLANADKRSDEDARLKRMVHSMDFGTVFGVPTLPEGKDAYDFVMPMTAGESGFTNKLVELELIYRVAVTRTGSKTHLEGPLADVKLVKGLGTGAGGPDHWIDVAVARKALVHEGELSADLEDGVFQRASSRVLLSTKGKFSGGAGSALFERKIGFRVE